MKRILTLCLIQLGFYLTVAAQPCVPNTNSLYFDGVSGNVRISGVNGLEPTAAITVEAWVNAKSFAAVQSGNSIFCKHRWDNFTYGYVLRAGGNGILSFNMAGAVGGTGVGWKEVASNTGALTLDTWYHVAATFDGATLLCYVNGVQSGSTAFSGTINMSTGLVPRIGRLADTTWGQTRYWNGMIDEVRVWNRALSQAEIQAGMNDHLDPAAQTGLVGYWRLNDGTGTFVTDLGSGNNPGSNFNALWTPQVPFNNISLPTPVVTWVAPNLHSSYSSGNQWYNGSTLIPGATLQNYHPTAYGIYRVIVTDTTGCTATSAPFMYNTTGLSEVEQGSLSISPNPATAQTTLNVPALYRNSVFRISDITGRVLITGNTGESNKHLIDISTLNHGVYLLSLKNSKNPQVLKFIVE